MNGGILMCWFWWSNFGYWGWFIMGIIGLVILLLFGYSIYRFFEKRQQESDVSNYTLRKNRSLEILKERLARGEITEDEYERLKEKLFS